MFFRSIRLVLRTSLTIGVCAIIVYVLFDFHYSRGVDNDPLKSPVRVISIDGNRLLLGDGRSVFVRSEIGRLSEVVEVSDYQIDIELDDKAIATVFVKSELAGCGDPFYMVRKLFPPYQIRLIPKDFPLNFRERVGSGRISGE